MEDMKKQNIKLKVKTEKKEFYISWEQGQSLLEVLQKNQLVLSHSCHGNGTCGKCKVKILSEDYPVTEADRRRLSVEELAQGIRLACKAKAEILEEAGKPKEIFIEILDESEENMVIEGSSIRKGPEISTIEKESFEIHQNKQNSMAEKEYFIAVDIGTTTIAMALVEEGTGNIPDMYFSINHQRKFGADVLSRIKAANEQNAEELKRLIEKDLWQGICKLAGIKKDIFQNGSYEMKKEKVLSEIRISRIVIAGNTTMIHLLMGYACETLGRYPFVSKHLKQIECTLKECIKNCFEDFWKQGIIYNWDNSIIRNDTKKVSVDVLEKYENIPVIILPGISAFVGGDIVSGLLCCPEFETEEICLLIDLGTNGEMVLGNKDRLLTASAAAGPAFEGGNIICGTAGIPGSICQVKIQNQRAVVKAIKEEIPPVGICGSGLVSCIAQLKQNNMIDGAGSLRYPYSKQGFSLWTFENGEKIAVYQQDIREFQKAKSAIRAGIEILMEEYGCKDADISRVYLAGGFGTNLSVEDAVVTGILPETFLGKTESIGNSALKGAILYGLGMNGREKTEEFSGVSCKDKAYMEEKAVSIVQRSKNVSLAENRKFENLYLEYMGF